MCSRALEIPAALMPEIFEDKTFLNLSVEVMEDLLSRDDLYLNEKSLFDMVIEWGKARQEDVKRLLKKVCYLFRLFRKNILQIRYPLMGAKILIEDIKGHELVSHEDYIEAIEYFACPRIFKDCIKKDLKFRSRRGMCQFGWDVSNNANVDISNFGKTVKKSGINDWDTMILSDVSMESGLQVNNTLFRYTSTFTVLANQA